MNENDVKKVIAGCVTTLAEVFGKVITPTLLSAYQLGLRGMTPGQIQLATQKALETCKFMPAPAELRDLTLLRVEDRAAIAFAALGNAVAQHGHYSTVTFDDPTINAVVRDLGGWENIDDRKDWHSFFKRDFEKAYIARYRMGLSEDDCQPLIGFCDRMNWNEGIEKSLPVIKIVTGLPPICLPPVESSARMEKKNNVQNTQVPRLALKPAE